MKFASVLLFASLASTLALPQKGLADGPVEGLPGWSDEPTYVQSAPLEQTAAAIWPALFGEPFVPGISAVTLGAETSPGTFRVLVNSPRAGYYLIRDVGELQLQGAPLLASWACPLPLSESGTAIGSQYEFSRQGATYGASGVLWGQNGNWAYVSCAVTNYQFSFNIPAGFQIHESPIVILRTHWSLAEAGVTAAAFASAPNDAFELGEQFFADMIAANTRGGDGGSTQPQPDYAGFLDCIADAREQYDDDIHAARLKLEASLQLLATNGAGSPVSWIGGGALGGAGLGSIFFGPAGGAVGGFLGGCGGAIYGATGAVEAKRLEIYQQYDADSQAAWNAYRQVLMECAETHNIDLTEYQ